jgi:hypothetical protein
MNCRTVAILVSVGLLGISGCSGKEPVRSEKRELSPVYIGSSLVTRMSPVIEAVTGSDSVRSISFTEVPWFDSITNGDIWLEATARGGSTHPVFVLDPARHDWREIEGALPLEGLCIPPCSDHIDRLLSQEFDQPIRQCLDSAGTLRIGSQYVWGHSARLIAYNPEYQFKTIRKSQLVLYWSAALARRGDTLLMFSTHDDIVTGQLVDSLIEFDLLANRLAGRAAQYREHVDVAIGQEGIWRIESGNASDTIVCRSHDGSILHQFEFEGPHYTARTICERDSRLWIVSTSHQGEVDVAASDGAGICIFANVIQFSATTSLIRHQDGFAALSGANLVVMDSIGQITGEYELPVSNVSAILSDDETIWMTHHGPRGVYTDATLLTRFKLE